MAISSNISKNISNKNTPVLKPSDAPDLEYLRAQENQKVRGLFTFHEIRGGVLDFVHRKYKFDQMEKYSLKDGEIYELPLRVARHLNDNVSYPVYDYKKQVEGTASKPARGLVSSTSTKESSIEVVARVNRCSFANLEFFPIDGVSSTGKQIKEVI